MNNAYQILGRTLAETACQLFMKGKDDILKLISVHFDALSNYEHFKKEEKLQAKNLDDAVLLHGIGLAMDNQARSYHPGIHWTGPQATYAGILCDETTVGSISDEHLPEKAELIKVFSTYMVEVSESIEKAVRDRIENLNSPWAYQVLDAESVMNSKKLVHASFAETQSDRARMIREAHELDVAIDGLCAHMARVGYNHLNLDSIKPSCLFDVEAQASKLNSKKDAECWMKEQGIDPYSEFGSPVVKLLDLCENNNPDRYVSQDARAVFRQVS